MATEYITVAQVQTLLGAFTVPADWLVGTSPTRPVDLALTRARTLIDTFCGTTFVPVTRTLILDGSGRNELPLFSVTRYPIVTITSVHLRQDPRVDFVAGDLLQENVDYMVHASRLALMRMAFYDGRGDGRSSGVGSFDGWGDTALVQSGPFWPRTPRCVKLIATFGRNGIPANVTKAAVLLVREEMQPGYISDYSDAFYNESFADGYSRSKTPKGVATHGTAESTGHEAVDRLLTPYRAMRIGFGV